MKRGKLDQIRWDSVAKIAAGILVAIAIATSLPSLLGSDDPAPLEPDVGLPQAALPPPEPPVPPVPKPEPTKKPKPHPKKSPPKKKKPDRASDPPPVDTSAPAAVPSGSVEDFGFERP